MCIFITEKNTIYRYLRHGNAFNKYFDFIVSNLFRYYMGERRQTLYYLLIAYLKVLLSFLKILH